MSNGHVPRGEGARTTSDEQALQVVSINRSCWAGAREALAALPAEVGIVLVQEHKLSAGQIDTASAALHKAGWCSAFSTAAFGAMGGSSSGVAILTR